MAAFTKPLRADFKDRLLSKANLPVVRVIFIFHHFHRVQRLATSLSRRERPAPQLALFQKGGVTHLVGKFLPVCISLISAKSWLQGAAGEPEIVRLCLRPW